MAQGNSTVASPMRVVMLMLFPRKIKSGEAEAEFLCAPTLDDIGKL